MRQGIKHAHAIQTVLTGLNTDWQEKIPNEDREKDSNESMMFGRQARSLANTLGR